MELWWSNDDSRDWDPACNGYEFQKQMFPVQRFQSINLYVEYIAVLRLAQKLALKLLGTCSLLARALPVLQKEQLRIVQPFAGSIIKHSNFECGGQNACNYGETGNHGSYASSD